MRARFYSPELRRFINADVLHGDIINALTLNRYAYCNGDPVNGIDPLGLSAERGSGFYYTDTDIKNLDSNDNSKSNFANWFDNLKSNVADWFDKFINALAESFEFEIGVGYGLGASVNIASAVDVELEAYSDTLTWVIDDNYDFMANSGSIGAQISLLDIDRASIGVSGSFYHEYIQQLRPCHTTLSNPFDAATCEYAKTTPVSVSIPIYGKISESYSSDDLVIGLSASLHLGLGGHINIGINIDELINEMGW